ncbi:transcriptional activator NhaR [Solimicrobium silvestre]|nr:transcriptional activator NhaR [Solimicrobium silvestre]
MPSLNYKHLHYFWSVAKHGSIIEASRHLHITPQTISAQLNLFEETHGEKLFLKSGRNLELSESGRMVLNYANEIFSLGQELEEVLQLHPSSRSLFLRVGISDAVPKTIAHKLLEPALQLSQPLRINCQEGKIGDLLAELAAHKLDVVISDAPMPAMLNVRAYNHFLLQSDISFFASPTLIAQHPQPFPFCLHEAPLLLQGEDTAVRLKLLQWLNAAGVNPIIAGEFDDAALMMAFGKAGVGFFSAPSSIAELVEQQYQVNRVGNCPEVLDHFYAISIERKISHPAVLAIQQGNRQ